MQPSAANGNLPFGFVGFFDAADAWAIAPLSAASGRCGDGGTFLGGVGTAAQFT